MSSKGVIGALVLAVSLALVTMVVVLVQNRGTGPGPSVPAGERVLSDFDAARVVSLSITSPGQGTDLVERDGPGGEWKITLNAGTGRARAWAADSERVRSVLRVLGETRAVGAPDAKGTIGEGGISVRIGVEPGAGGKAGGAANGEEGWMLRLSPRSLGGQLLIGVSRAGEKGRERLALVTDGLGNIFAPPGARSWRKTQMLPGVAASASAVRMVTPEASLALARSGQKWSLKEPVSAPADPEAIRKMLATLEGVRIARFFDESGPDSAAAGLESPVARVVMALEQRRVGANDVEVSSVDRELVVGGRADPAGNTLHASIDGGRTVVAIEAAGLAGISTDPTRWIAAQALDLQPADIQKILIAGRAADHAATGGTSGTSPAAPTPTNEEYRRTLEGWNEVRPEGALVLLDARRGEQVGGLLNALTAAPAQAVLLAEPTGYQAMGTLTVTSRDGTNEELALGRSAASALVIRTGKVYRGYANVPDLLRPVMGATQTVNEPAPIDKMK
jgi:hypothetical protein